MKSESPYRAIRSDGIEVPYASSEALHAAIRAGQIGPGDLVRLSDQGPWTTAGNIASPSESEGDGGPSAYEWVCGECGKDIANYDTLCPACGADVAEEEDHVDSPPHLFHGYRGWWMGFGSLSFIYGLMISGDVPSAIGFAVAAIAIPALLSAGVWATWKVLGRPLTKGQIMSTFAVAWTLVMGLNLIGRLGQP